jgi:hypothetical protein
MSTALRLDDDLIREAEREGRLNKRTTPKQIELWAEIGKQLAELITPNELIAVQQGFARLRIEATHAKPVEIDEVFEAVEQDRTAGRLSAMVTQAPIYYETSRSRPGLLDRVQPDGTRTTGHFRNGEFVPIAAA